MKLIQRLLVLLIAMTMMLSGSFVQAFAAEEAEGIAVAVPAADSVGQPDAPAASGEEKGSAEVAEPEEEPVPEPAAAAAAEAEEASEESGKEKSEAEAVSEGSNEKAAKAEASDGGNEEAAKAEAASENGGEEAAGSEEVSDNGDEEAEDIAESEELAEEAEEASEEDEKEPSAGVLKYKDDDITVTLEYGKKAGLTEDTELAVREITADSPDKKEQKEYEEYHDISLEQLRSEEGGDSISELGFARFFDITLINEGKEIEPEDDVKVTITFNRDSGESVEDSKTDSVRVIHLKESGNTGDIKAEAISKEDTDLTLEKEKLTEAAFTTDSFSVYGIVYTVDFEYEGYTYSIPGGSEIMLSELFGILHIEEDASTAENVEFTDPELIRVEKTEDGWKLTSLKPFDTEEKLTVTLPGKIIEIDVTDAQGNNTFLLHREALSNEYFRTRVFTSRPGGTQTQAGTAGTVINSDGSFGWNDFENLLNKYYSNYSNAGSDKRYSVTSAMDPATRSQLVAAGFQESRISGIAHAACGLYTQSDWLGRNGNGSATTYDLDIMLNDNSIPVRIYVDGVLKETTVFLSDAAGDHTAGEIAGSLGYSDYMLESGKINGTDVSKVTVSELTGQELAGKRIQRNGTSITVIGVSYRFDAFDYTYPKAYKWTYNNGTAVGDKAYDIRLVTPIARVSNDGGSTWTYHAYLINSGTQGDGVTKNGAFDQANTLTGDVIIETLLEDTDRYTLTEGFNFSNSGINSLTLRTTDDAEWNPDGFRSMLVKDQTAAPMITTTGIGKVELNKIIFNGNDKITTNGNGGAVKTDADELAVSSCAFNRCQAGYQGGGIYHSNTDANMTIEDSTFTGCRANGPDDTKGAGGGGVFTDAQSLTVTDSTFDSCTTRMRQGAGLFHKRTKTDPANSQTLVKDCKFENCEAKWSGGGIESDAWKVTLDNVEFNNCKATKGGAINVWADGQDSTSNDTTFNITNCAFKDCTGTDNGGAVRSTSLHTNISDSSFENCKITVLTGSGSNGGAVACTNNKTIATITGCTFTNCSTVNNGGAIFTAGTVANATTVTGTTIEGCSAERSGGAIRSANITLDNVTISDCSAAEKGGAVHSTQTITMNGGSVTGCTTNGDSAALDAETSASGLVFSGDAVVEGNTGSGGEARDVYIGYDTDRHILINRPGLGDNASIGVYVADANSAFEKHGKPNQMFAHTGSAQASSMSNLDKLFSDRLDNGEMHGMPAVSGENYSKRIMWSGSRQIAPTGVDLRALPYLLILLGGAALVMLKRAADRRRNDADDTAENGEKEDQKQ